MADKACHVVASTAQVGLIQALCGISDMRDRFTHKSKTDRGRMRREIKDAVLKRDHFRCQYCSQTLDRDDLTIDHLIPVSGSGLDEITNYVTCCLPCNQRKANMPLAAFAESLNLPVERLPVHGDPVIDNLNLPIQIRAIRKRVFDLARLGEHSIAGTSAQKKLEKHYRRAFWETKEGKLLEETFSSLPGHVRVMIPEIETIAKNESEFLLLVELAKSASTRNMIGTILSGDKDIIQIVASMKTSSNDEKLRKRLSDSWARYERALRAAALLKPSAT